MNKRIIALVSIVALLVSMFAFMAPASAYYAVYSHCRNGKPLNVRSGPGKEYSIVGKYNYGEMIYVIGETYPGWLQIENQGYVQASLTCAYDPGPYVPSPTPTKSPSEKKQSTLDATYASAKTVTPYMITLQATPRSKGVANVRWQPIKSAKLLRAYAPGTQLKVLAELNKWYQVQDPATQEVGYVNVAYVVK